MSASDPSGAEMRSPNGRFFCVVAEPTGNDHLVEGRSDSTLCGRQITDLWLTSRGIVDPTYGDRHVVCRSCDAVANGRVPSEVSPRSSGGAPPSELALDKGDLARLQASLAREGALGAVNSWALISEMRRALAQVSALRQEAAITKAAHLESERELSAARQEAETLRKQLDEAKQAADDANQEEAVVRRTLDSQVLDYEALSREAETLRGQLDAAQRDSELSPLPAAPTKAEAAPTPETPAVGSPPSGAPTK
jgi:hypothetical protein